MIPMNSLRLSLVSLATVLVLFASAPIAQAACDSTTFCPLTDVQGSRLETIYQNSDGTTLSGFLTGLFTAVISVSAILAVLRLGYAGYLYMTSESWGSKGKAKEVIGDTVLGLLLLLSCWLILNQINPDILKLTVLDSLRQTPIENTNAPAGPASPSNNGNF